MDRCQHYKVFKKWRYGFIITSKNASPSLHWLSSAKTGKARAAIRRYWQDKSQEINKEVKKTTLALLRLIYHMNQGL
jgi:(p)ppGpp synthase/HD superfamily hydrolase